MQQVFEALLSKNPNPKTELNFTNNFTLLVAVVLSAQATDVSVNKATKNLFLKAKTPQDVIDLGEEYLLKELKTINYYKTKVKNILGLCSILISKFNSNVPDSLQSLISLPGVGRKTANVVLSSGFGRQALAVDTHVARLATRLALTKNTKPELIEGDLVRKAKRHNIDLNKLHHLFILHGRYVCKAQKPMCGECVIKDFCSFAKQTYKKPICKA